MGTISAAARTALRSAATRSSRSAPTRLPASSNPKFPLSATISRLPVEMSCVVQSMLPYHTATASASLVSMLSQAPRCYAWIIEDK